MQPVGGRRSSSICSRGGVSPYGNHPGVSILTKNPFMRSHHFPPLLAAFVLPALPLDAAEAKHGLFDQSQDMGTVARPGSAAFDPVSGRYRITGGGENMWFGNDAFHFVWTRVSGDLALAADIQWPAAAGHAHRKACLLVRQNLAADSPYVDAAVHGDGLTSLQFRAEPGGPTREIQTTIAGPRRVAIERQGNTFWMSVGGIDEPLHPAGGSVRLPLQDPVYVGLGVCAHDNNALAEAVFGNVRLVSRPPVSSTNRVLESTLETVSIASKDRRAVYWMRDHLEAPNWTPDGRYFLFNSHGRIHRLPVSGGTPESVDTGFAKRCNNDHGISPDGTQLVISDQSQTGKSLIYVLPIGGGVPQQVTDRGPSYWHGWSPDGRTLGYCAERNGEYDVYTIAASGGEETRLTTAQGLDDGPEYSPDGRFIYFNSDRTGLMQLWRMRPDGSAQEQITRDELNNWFPHPSPDGKWIVFLTYAKEVQGHPANQDVRLRLMPVGGGEPQVLATLFGGQGTANVPSWSPDSRHVAFVSYRLAVPSEP